MTLCCALYARHSFDQQRAASIKDQFRICREHAEHEGGKIENMYRDAVISGASVILRPGVLPPTAGATPSSSAATRTEPFAAPK
ncbi:MAG: recombinase family protein [Rhodobacteraceae bacterium]|nr:recombinase family protein [Paracoccaceae bacterium]